MEKKQEVGLIRLDQAFLVPVGSSQEELISPAVDIYETPDAFVLMLDMPGTWKDGIRVSLDPEVLNVRGNILSIHTEPAKRLIAKSYVRTFNLSRGLETGKTSAEFQDGVLTITIPKTESFKVKEIPIQS